MKTPNAISYLGISSSVEEIVRDTISAGNMEEPFYVVDIQDIVKKHRNWLKKLPRVRPYYAVKCNSCPIVLETLAALGTGFDCASKAEIDTVLEMNVSPNNIIFANPCKTMSFIRHAAAVGVDLMTFDNEEELYKVAKFHADSRMVLRIKVDDSHAVCQFSSKFGADVEKAEHLLSVAKSLGLNVVGVSFHVGSGCENAKCFADAIKDARYVFDVAKTLGFKMTLLDLGGGYPGTSKVPITFDEIAQVINEALGLYFPEGDEKLSVIAEPGRYYVASAFTLATMVIAKRVVDTSGSGKSAMYYLNDGVYGSFNCTIFDHWDVHPTPFVVNRVIPPSAELYCSTLWGPTCDSMDCIKKGVLLPELNIGEWIIFQEMGAYTIAAASTFNGFQLPSLKFNVSSFTLAFLRNLQAWPRLRMVLNLTEDQNGEDIFDVDHRLLGLIDVDRLITVH